MSGACTCLADLADCGGSCVDLSSSAQHCGACGDACGGGAVCTSGACTCAGGATECSGSCVDTQSDPDHCGGCGLGCDGGGCAAGTCVACPTPDVSFQEVVGPLLDQRCTASGCHAGARPAAGIRLTTGQAWASLVGVPASCGSVPLVTPGQVDRSYAWNKLTGVGICSGTQMPKRGQSLSSMELAAIESWICHGARND